MPTDSHLSGLRDHAPSERRDLVAASAGLEPTTLRPLDPAHGLSVAAADHMVENVVGLLGVPVGIGTNLVVDGCDRLVPMATEEPSVVAAMSNAARMARPHGGFVTSSTGDLMTAQVQVVGCIDPEAARQRVLGAREELLGLADAQDPLLVELGGGARDITARTLPTRVGVQLVVHLLVDVRDAMGANAVNTMAEALAPRIGELAGARPLLRILTNKADRRVTRVRATFDRDLLGGGVVVDDVVAASAFAEADPYRAATHNKGIMNGVTAVVLATGNDTRAVEAGCHAHAARSGRYTALSCFERGADGHLVGTRELPLPVGLVGGATRAHPVAQAAVRLLGVSGARELAAVVAAVGLAQNLAACRALVAEGIQRGHMRLHARTVAASVGAGPDEVGRVAEQIVADGEVREDHARTVLVELRQRGAQG